MNKIFRVFTHNSLIPEAVGYLIKEDQDTFKMRIQDGRKQCLRTYSKSQYHLMSIYEVGSGENYQIKTTDVNKKAVTIDLSKSCFGGCG